jgi:hypothetical protein
VDMYGTRRAARLSLADMDLVVEPHEDGLRFAFSLPRGAYATTVLREFMKVPVEQRLPTGAAADDDDDDDNRDGSGAGADRQQHKKQKRGAAPRRRRRPATLEEITSHLSREGIPFEGPRGDLARDAAGYNLFLLRGTRGKKRVSLVVFDGRPGIKACSDQLGYKPTARLSSAAAMEKALGCTAAELSPLSLLSVGVTVDGDRTDSKSLAVGVQAAGAEPVTVAVDATLLGGGAGAGEDGGGRMLWLKAASCADEAVPCRRLGMRAGDFLRLIRSVGAGAPKTVVFGD